MYRTLASWIFLGSVVFLSASCSGSVEVIGQGGGGSGGSGGSGGTGGCSGSPPLWTCVHGCGSDFFEASVCKDGAWVCPLNTVPIDDCPPETCPGPPLPCEICFNGLSCVPNEGCIGSCESLVCGTCNSAPSGTLSIGACTCSCDATGNQYGCTLTPGCCNQDMDCGDEAFFPCVNHVCKQPVFDACWVDAECGPGMKCEGANVCPCHTDCDAPDMPGMCVPV